MHLAISANKHYQQRAIQLADNYQLPLLAKHPTVKPDFLLHYDETGLSLSSAKQNHREKPLHIDFLAGKSRHRRLYGGGKGQQLAKDAFVLATLGCTVTLIERTTPIYLLLNDALERVQQSNDEHVKQITSRMTLLHHNSLHYLQHLTPTDYPAVIYLDPMFPNREKSAKVKKDMLFFQTLVGKDNDSKQLLHTARSKAQKRIVVKRPRHADYLADKPNFQITGKSIRYDIYLPNADTSIFVNTPSTSK
jgi:16S rRNA (guanine1516-N2)-methyltransferase